MIEEKQVEIMIGNNLDATVIASTINNPIKGVRAEVAHNGMHWVVIIHYPQSSCQTTRSEKE